MDIDVTSNEFKSNLKACLKMRGKHEIFFCSSQSAGLR